MKIGKFRMGLSGHVKYEGEKAFFNVGDPIQSYATTLIYETIGIKESDIIELSLDEVKVYDGDELVFPMNLNLSQENIDEFFPISPRIIPSFVSQFYVDDIFDGRSEIVSYFQEHGPIGCRDEKTRNLCRKYDIESYLMGDFSFVFGLYFKRKKGGSPFLVDLSEKAFNSIPPSLRDSARILSHAVRIPDNYFENESENEKELAKKYISEYQNASIVVSSRIHAVVPAMSMGIPVVLMSDNLDYRFEWLDKYIKLYQVKDYPFINWNQIESVNTEWTIKQIIEIYSGIATGNINKIRSIMSILDGFYMDRERACYYGTFIERLERVKQTIGASDFKYILWGAGIHCAYVYELTKQRLPNGTLVAIVDKYKSGERYGVQIIRPEEIKGLGFDYCFITSRLALPEAKDYLKMYYNGKHYEKMIVELCSQQVS